MSFQTSAQTVINSDISPDIQTANNEFEDFIYLISHDVRNSVRALIELPQWISEDLGEAGVKVDGSVAESIALMNKHTGRLDRMLVDLLSFSRVGRMQETVEVELDVALTEVLDEVRLPPGFQLIPPLDANTIEMGERDILTLLSSLISNAVKHHDRATGKIAVAVREEDKSIFIEISDDGPGIPPIYAERVFGAMTTLRPRDEVEGSGMGLAIVQKIIRFYGGSIALSDGLSGRGTTVSLQLPKTVNRSAL